MPEILEAKCYMCFKNHDESGKQKFTLQLTEIEGLKNPVELWRCNCCKASTPILTEFEFVQWEKHMEKQKSLKENLEPLRKLNQSIFLKELSDKQPKNILEPIMISEHKHKGENKNETENNLHKN